MLLCLRVSDTVPKLQINPHGVGMRGKICCCRLLLGRKIFPGLLAEHGLSVKGKRTEGQCCLTPYFGRYPLPGRKLTPCILDLMLGQIFVLFEEHNTLLLN